MAGKHAKVSTKGEKAKKVAKATGKGALMTVVGTAMGVRATAKGAAAVANFCLNPSCLHDARKTRCRRKCCQ
jgi:hypothetical protein